MDPGKIRLEKRKRQKKIMRRIRAIIILLIISLGVYLLLTTLPLFSIKNFSVSGNKYIKDNEIVNKSGLIKGENIFKIKKDVKIKNILTEPYIESAEINRVIPDTIEIKVKEKTDRFRVESNNNIVYLGKNGEVLSVIEKEKDNKNSKAPYIEGFKLKNVTIGKTLKYQNKNIDSKEYIDFISGISKEEIYKLIKKIKIESDGNVIIEVKDDFEIKLGKFNDMEYKLKLLEEVIKDLNKKKVKFKLIDFTRGKRVVVEKLTFKDREELYKEQEELENKEPQEDAQAEESIEDTIEDTNVVDDNNNVEEGNQTAEEEEQPIILPEATETHAD